MSKFPFPGGTFPVHDRTVYPLARLMHIVLPLNDWRYMRRSNLFFFLAAVANPCPQSRVSRAESAVWAELFGCHRNRKEVWQKI